MVMRQSRKGLALNAPNNLSKDFARLYVKTNNSSLRDIEYSGSKQRRAPILAERRPAFQPQSMRIKAA
jgi:hypothetical protein